MAGRVCQILVFGVLVTVATGCGPRSRLREDPFLRRPGGAGSAGGGAAPYQPTSDPNRDFSRDLSRDVSTSPATDPNPPRDSQYVGGLGGNDRGPRDGAVPERNPAVNPSGRRDDPLFANEPRDRERAPALSTSQGSTAPSAGDSGLTYEGLRRRLDRAGARNLRLEPYDEQPGERLFRCEVPYPSDPDKLRVFQAHGPDELKVMTAVAEAVEGWLARETAP